MNTRILKILCAVLALLLLPAICLPVSAGAYVKGANAASDSYKSGPYYDRLLSVPLTGDGRTDVLAVALSQLGYQESDTSGEFSGTVGGTANFTEYNYNFGKYNNTDGYGYYWCASFVSFCLLQARCHNYTKLSDWCRGHENDPNYIWREISCLEWAEQLRRYGYFEDSVNFDGDYRPLPGDLIFFTKNGSTESHIGLVLYSTDTTVYTVEGNTSSASGLDTNGGGVYFKSYSLSSSYIRGYGVLPYEVSNDSVKIDYSGGSITPGLYVATTNKYVYTTETASSYTWLLPRYSTFTVTEIAGNGRVKATCTINGETVTGYVKNNTDRIIQYTARDALTGYQSASQLWGHRADCIDFYHLNETASASAPSTPSLTVGDTVGINGWIGFTRPLSGVGYYFDDSEDSISWSGTITTPEAAVTAAGGENAKRYKVMADTEGLSAGKHSVTFVVKLSDGTIGALTTVSFRVSPPPETTIASVTTTQEPISTTTEPTSTTQEPVSTTQESVSTTTEPVSTTTEPSSTTEEPVSTTTEPSSTTEEPVSTTTEPVSTTTEPVSTTQEPFPTTTEPASTTEEPVSTTTEPASTTEEPHVTTSAPVSTTSNHSDETSEAEPTDGDTSAPAEPTETTTEPTASTDGTSTEEIPSDGTTDGSTPESTTDEPSASSRGCSASVSLPALLLGCLPALLLKKRDEE